MNDRVRSGAALALRWLSGGAGAALVWLLWEALRSSPGGLWNVLEAWGPGFGIAAVAIYVLDRRAGQFVSALTQTAAAQHNLSEAVQQMAEKDDRRAQATDAAIAFVAQQSERILAELCELKARMSR